MIIRCASRRALYRASPRCRTIAGQWHAVAKGHPRYYSQNATDATRPDTRIPWNLKAHQYPVFQHVQYPDRDSVTDPSVWSHLLEAGLPLQLRLEPSSRGDTLLDAAQVAQILVAAQRPIDLPKETTAGIDLLYYLGVNQGRWDAVIWIVKRLVEAFASQSVHHRTAADSFFRWRTDLSLSKLTTSHVDLDDNDVFSKSVPASPVKAVTLDELTQNAESGAEQHDMLRRDCLGQIWRSLGRMTMDCADGAMKPEILEIIAYLHHMEIMPASIYNLRPSKDSTAIQQPPILRLFSSRILTSLSDAAWRAHEKLVVQEAKAKGGDYASARPEIPGQAYRVRVPGLRPEVWMELILWTCLHGDWVTDGLKILRMLCQEPAERQWRPLSFRSLASPEGGEYEDWDKYDYIFNTRPRSETKQRGTKSGPDIRRTISSEVINAYVDATLSITRLRYGLRGMPPREAVRYLTIMKSLLDRAGMSLSTGTWDSVIVRFIDQQPHITDIDRHHMHRLVALSPAMGEELQADRGPQLPDYVMDPSAALLGLFHRALLAKINDEDLKSAFRLFQALQDRADSNKHQSIVDFLRRQQQPYQDSTHPQDHTSTGFSSGIDYPAFDLQIPPTILAAFLDLVTDSKAYDFGKWLLHSNDLDGPVIRKRHYSDAALRPALIRFAAETGDNDLLTELVSTRTGTLKRGEAALPEKVLQSFLDSQVNLRRWDAAERILQHMYVRKAKWNAVSLAHVIRIMLSEFRGSTSDTTDSDFCRANSLVRQMISVVPNQSMERYGKQVGALLTMVASLDPYWADYCLELDCLEKFYRFDLPTKAFNLALEGIVDGYGSVTGRRILGLFWPHAVRFAQRADKTTSFDEVSDQYRSFSYTPSQTNAEQLTRNVIRIRGQHEQTIAIYGGLQPDLMTIRIIFQKALQDFRNRDSKPILPSFAASEVDSSHDSIDASGLDLSESGMVVWAIRCLRALRMADEDILAELEGTLEAHDMTSIRAKIPELFEQADEVETGHEVTNAR